MTLSHPSILLALTLTAFGCAGCSSQLPPPCDPVTAANLAAQCGLAGETCAAHDVAEGDCIELMECRQRADERQAYCAKLIEES